MKAFQEITEWAWPNHVYFLSDDKSKMYAYINKQGKVDEPSTPYRFSTSGRKFKEVANTWNYAPKEVTEEVAVGEQHKVPGSNGAIYTVTNDMGSWSCTCPASKWQKGECKHITKIKLNAQ